MPIYEYECQSCGRIFETFQKISDDPLTECEVCKGPVNRLISNCSFQLKGTGWYVTDYKSPVSGARGNGGRHGKARDQDGDDQERGNGRSGMKAGDTVKFPFGKGKKDMTGIVDRVFEKTVYIRADMPHQKGKIIKRKVQDVKA
jgi:putative FmdB family regulatory protein